jgi:hypothetical protein
MLKSRSSSASWSWKTRVSHTTFDSTLHQHLPQNLNQRHTQSSQTQPGTRIYPKSHCRNLNTDLSDHPFSFVFVMGDISHHILREKRHFLCFFCSTESTRLIRGCTCFFLKFFFVDILLFFSKDTIAFIPSPFYRDLTILKLRFRFFLYILLFTPNCLCFYLLLRLGIMVFFLFHIACLACLVSAKSFRFQSTLSCFTDSKQESRFMRDQQCNDFTLNYVERLAEW